MFSARKYFLVERAGCVLATFCLGALLTTATSSRAAPIYYNARAAFDLANPGLPTETFEAGNVAPGSFALFTGPLNSATANAIVSPGSILPGVTLVDNPGPDANDMVYVGVGTQPGVSKAVLTRAFNDSMDLIFSPGVSAVGFDYAACIGPGVINFGSFTISVYGAGDLFLGSTFISTPENATVFFGVFSATDQITRVNVYDAAIHSELIDNLSFGTSVPEPASASLLAASALLLALKRRRLSAAAPRH